jgi:hypothetical protein
MEAKAMRWPIVLAAAVLMLAILACGGFQVRVTPTPKPSPQPKAQPTTAPTATPAPTAKPTIARTATITPTLAAPPTAPSMTVGGKARVTAAGGVNVRDKASAKGKQVGRLNLDAVVALLEGPVQADSYAWWRVDNGSGLTGWVAGGPANDPWLVPAKEANVTAQPAGTPKLVNRPIKLGDRVQVTTAPGQPLTVRDAAGKTATAIAKVLPGTLFTVRGGPMKQDGLTWWQLEGDAVKGWAAEGDGVDRWLTPVE